MWPCSFYTLSSTVVSSLCSSYELRHIPVWELEDLGSRIVSLWLLLLCSHPIVSFFLYAINPLIDDFCLEENTSAFFLSASVNVQSRKWKLLYLFQAKGGVMQAIGPKAPERVGGGGCPIYEPHSSIFRKPQIFRKCCTVTFVALGTTGYCSHCLKHLRILDRNGPFSLLWSTCPFWTFHLERGEEVRKMLFPGFYLLAKMSAWKLTITGTASSL